MPPTPDAQFDVRATVAQLFVYPVKSCAGVQVQQAILTETGLEFDRAWMVVDAAGNFVTQRELPRMALIQPQIKHFEMVLRAPGMLALHVALDAVEQPCRATVWGHDCAAFDMGDIAAQWFSDFLAPDLPTKIQPLRLVRFDPNHRRLSNLQWTAGVEALNQFSDGYPILVTSQASVSALNDRLAALGHSPVAVQRFRPNIVLAGIEAHDEDRFAELRIQAETEIETEVEAQFNPNSNSEPEPNKNRPASVRLALAKPCPRCPIPNIDPETALASPHVGEMLQTYRQDPRVDGAVTFGMNAIVLDGLNHLLRVGQAVHANYVFD